MPMARFQQRQELRAETRLLTIRLSELLELREKDYRSWVALIERDPLFGLLKHPPQGQSGAIRRQPWPQTHWRPPEPGQEPPMAAEAAAPSDEMVALIQRIGQAAFERYFLYNDGETPASEAARACGLTEPEARRLFDFLDGTLAAAAMAGPVPAPAESGSALETVAAFERGPDGLTLAFFSAHYARGLYRIDYDAVERLKRTGVVPKADWRRVRELLGRLESVNAKQTVLTGLLKLALARQARFLESADPADLASFTQKEAAERLGVAPSSVSRALAGRAVRLPWGGERGAAELFPSQRDVGVEFVRAALAREPGLKDRELWDRLRRGPGIRVTVRSVNIYRRQASGG